MDAYGQPLENIREASGELPARILEAGVAMQGLGLLELFPVRTTVAGGDRPDFWPTLIFDFIFETS